MKTAIIYARVSSLGSRQDTARQVQDLRNIAKANGFKIIKVVEEHASGAKRAYEREFQKVLEFAKENKCIILVSELSRIGRNIADVTSSVQFCIENQIQMFIQKDNIYLLGTDGKANPVAKIIIYVLSMVAEYERENIYFRLKSGRDKYKENGGKFGRPKGASDSKQALLQKPGYEKAVRLLREGRRISSIMAELKGQEKPVNITRPTLMKLRSLFCE